MPPPDGLVPRLERILRTKQADGLPSLAAAVVRGGETVWSDAVGTADYEAGSEATPETQYRIGSITKTFTAVAVMMLRDEGLLDLDDRLEQHVPGIANGSPTIRRMLAHLSGLQREPGDMWVDGVAPTLEAMVAGMADYELVLPPARAHHYSNLAYGMLGEIVARRSGLPYTEFVDVRIFAPAGLRRTSWEETPPRAAGYMVDEYAGTVMREPHTPLDGIAAMGQLWSTVGDLARWGMVLVGGLDGVVAEATAEEMWAPQVILNPDDWTVGWGLGLELLNHSGRIFGGHTGAMPGFLAGLHLNRESKTGAAVLTNSGTRAATRDIAVELAEATLELWPPDIELWRPESAPPREIVPILGRWWSEGMEFVFSWREGKLQATIPGAPPRVRPTVFESIGDGVYRAVSGREQGERLRVEADDRLVWSGYLFTRSQEQTPGA